MAIGFFAFQLYQSNEELTAKNEEIQSALDGLSQEMDLDTTAQGKPASLAVQIEKSSTIIRTANQQVEEFQQFEKILQNQQTISDQELLKLVEKHLTQLKQASNSNPQTASPVRIQIPRKPAPVFTFDGPAITPPPSTRLRPVSIPASDVVVAGLPFYAQLEMVANANKNIQFEASDGQIEQAEDGTYLLSVPATGQVIPKGKSQGTQRFSFTSLINRNRGKTDSITIEEEYAVQKPEIIVRSAAIQILYRNCGNEVEIDVPSLGQYYQPLITAQGASVIQSKKEQTKFRIVPTTKQCVLSVKNNVNGNKMEIGTIQYKVIEPPRPQIQMAVNGRVYNGRSLVPKTSRVAVRLIPDPDFKNALPEDAKYGVRSIDVLAQLSLGPPTKVNSVRGSNRVDERPIGVSLGIKVRQSARPGTKVYIRLNDIYRINALGKQIPEKRFKEMERTKSLIVK